MGMNEHTSKQFEAELEATCTRVLQMGGLVEAQIRAAIDGFTEGDEQLLARVVADDHRVNAYEVSIDEACAQLIARRQPAAGDLRLIMAISKIVTDLERVGDLCVNLAERVLELNQEPQLKPYISLPTMGAEASALLRKALDAYVSGNVEEARAVLAAEQRIDDMNVQIFRELLTYMIEDPRTITRAMRLIFISKYLERVADHATNIAEQVIFMVEGSDVRHGAGYPHHESRPDAPDDPASGGPGPNL